jgi:hypothetical protein
MDADRIHIRSMTWGLIVTGIVALAGIVATFFAPSYSENKISQRRALRDFRTARRLIAAELGTLRHQLDALAEAGMPDPVLFETTMLLTREYDAHKTSLAGLLPEAEWDAVANAYLQVEGTRFMLRNQSAIDEDTARVLRSDMNDLQEAVDALQRAAPMTD